MRVLTWNMMHAVVRGAARRLAAWQYLDGLKAEGMAIPEPSSSSTYVDVPA